MSKQAVHDFREAVNSDATLQEKLRSLAEVDVVAFAGEHGYEFSADDLAAVIDEVGDELSDFELEMVSGGASLSTVSDGTSKTVTMSESTTTLKDPTASDPDYNQTSYC